MSQGTQNSMKTTLTLLTALLLAPLSALVLYKNDDASNRRDFQGPVEVVVLADVSDLGWRTERAI